MRDIASMESADAVHILQCARRLLCGGAPTATIIPSTTSTITQAGKHRRSKHELRYGYINFSEVVHLKGLICYSIKDCSAWKFKASLLDNLKLAFISEIVFALKTSIVGVRW